MKTPRIMIMHAPGTNRDRDAAAACELAGGEAHIVHINRLIAKGGSAADGEDLRRYQMLVLPGGFSYGDDLGAGRLWANDLTVRFRQAVDAFVDAGKPVMGICNGFQALVKAGYLPGPAPEQRVTLTFNRHGHFECRWVRLRAVAESRCLFTADLEEDILCPVAHGEGRLAVPDDATRRTLWDDQLIALRYVRPVNLGDMDDASSAVPVHAEAGYPYNPNGSVNDIAGICNAAGNVFGLMPHPENHILGRQHPRWAQSQSKPGGLGIHLFRNGVRAAQAFL